MSSLYRSGGPLLALILLATALSGDAQDSDALGPDEWPKTLAAAVEVAIQMLPVTEQDKLKAMKRENLILLHHGYGMGLRNYLGLWRGNTDLIESACGHPCQPDDASMIIIEAIWQKLQQ